jgi:crotonobetainyl-CoA:carnitine CoA-transferase CaiB-like acyl-CoA transferase
MVVADFSRILAGPYATMLLADLGATVIKVEGPGTGDDTRTRVPPTTADGTATYYLSINRNKRSIALDLADPDDLDVAQRLAARADVMIENFKPGGLRRFGLDHGTVAAGNPSVVYCSISGFGTAGGAALPGYDLPVQATSGCRSGSTSSRPPASPAARSTRSTRDWRWRSAWTRWWSRAGSAASATP